MGDTKLPRRSPLYGTVCTRACPRSCPVDPLRFEMIVAIRRGPIPEMPPLCVSGPAVIYLIPPLSRLESGTYSIYITRCFTPLSLSPPLNPPACLFALWLVDSPLHSLASSPSHPHPSASCPRSPKTPTSSSCKQTHLDESALNCRIPGPIEFSDPVLEANATPGTSHVSPAFIPVFGDCLRKLRKVLYAESQGTQPFLIAGSGTLGWDAAAANLVEAGEEVVVLKTGYFGDSFEEW